MVLFCLVVSIFGSIRFDFGGSISPGEILLLGYGALHFPDLLRAIKQPQMRSIFVFCLLYLASQITTDLIRGTPTIDCLRGWSRIGMMTVSFVIFSVLIGRNTNRMLSFVIGATLANALSALVIGADYAQDSDTIYKFLLGGPIALSAFIFAGYASFIPNSMKMMIPFFGGILAFFANARSLAGISLAASVSRWLFRRTPDRIGRIDLRAILSLIGIIVTAIAIFQFYNVAAPAGWLGEKARQRYEFQRGKLVGAKFSLLDGRQELQFSWPKIVASPIIGYGSWAKDRRYVYDRMIELGNDPLIASYEVAKVQGLIPTHSHLFGAWVEAGIVGALFWLFIVSRAGAVVLRGQLEGLGNLTPVGYYLFVGFFWDVIFSPFGGERRLWNGFLLWLLVVTPIMASQLKVSAMRLRPVRG